MKLKERLKISPAGKGVFSELFIEFAAFSLLLVPGYMTVQDWPRLTLTIGIGILFLRFAIQLRKNI